MLGAGLDGFLTVLPAAVDRKHDMDGGVGTKIDRHGMDQVTNCIELEKKEDEYI